MRETAAAQKKHFLNDVMSQGKMDSCQIVFEKKKHHITFEQVNILLPSAVNHGKLTLTYH